MDILELIFGLVQSIADLGSNKRSDRIMGWAFLILIALALAVLLAVSMAKWISTAFRYYFP